jgi:hypothetical protein
MAIERSADLRRAAEQARLAHDARVIDSARGRDTSTASTIVLDYPVIEVQRSASSR